MRLTILLIIGLLNSTANAQSRIADAVKNATSVADPPVAEMGLGLKEALESGVSAAAGRLSSADGFLGNAAVKILFPPEAQKVEKTLRGVGAGKLCDELIISLNRAAEDAAKEAKPIFIAAVKQMSIADAGKILLSDQRDAATQYFRNATSSELKAKFMPVIQVSLDKAGAAKNWTAVTSAYNKVPFTSKVNTDLNDYVTQKAIAGLFYEIAREELKLRSDISARNSPLLQKVFGYADKK